MKKRKRSAGAPGAEPPSWLTLVEMAKGYDYPGLNLYVRDHAVRLPLGAFLWFRSVEFSGSQALTIEVAKRALEVNPNCSRIMQGADRAAGVAYRHMTTAAVQ